MVEWVKGHAGVPGNEKADQLAKEGMEKKGPSAKETFTSTRYIRTKLKEKATKDWNESFEKEPMSRKGKNYTGKPETARKWKFPNNNRTSQVLNGRLRTRHINSGNYLYNIGKRATAECWCGDDKQDVKHILTRCPLLREERREARKEAGVENVTLEWLLYDKEGAKKAEGLWRTFEERRREWEQIEDEDEVAEERDRERGWGDMGREGNNEANLAERGYGE